MKKVFFALFAVVIAVGGSAFTNVKQVPGKIYGSTLTQYTLRSTSVYNNGDCEDNTPKLCAYQVTPAGKSVVIAASYSDAQMATFKTNGLVIELTGASSGIYTAP